MTRGEPVINYPALSPEVERRIVAMMRAELPKAAARIAEREAAQAEQSEQLEHVRAA
ncbi:MULTISPECIES: hypothetical protein [Glycomyces]|uniref:Uncharacterized protein n=2 Tax=Glycomyces TaxID=58113 RepID=A0ABU2AHT5_9ACTN|nr:hypothetical protein [Glycomyces lechevalierae]MDR7336772.1 hypothetical protein [Glycomyces lechevalierae]